MIAPELPLKFAKLESDVAATRGDFALFALFLREDVPDRWDLIVSAPWVSDQKAALSYLVDKIKADLGPSELTHLSRIVFVEPSDPAVQSLNKAIQVEHGSVEIRDSNFFGLAVKHAFIITSKRPQTPVPA
jgi:hypothetical protein